jgi:hypothetical protein
MNGSAILAAFAIIQVAARRKLSPALLIPISDDAFGYWDSDIIRANGLTGNPIVFGTIMSLCYCLHLARSVSYPTLKNFALAALVFGGLLASLSRAAMLIALAATFLIPLVALRKTRPSTPLLSLFLPALGLIAALVGIQSNVGRGSFLLSEIMFGANRAVQNSTQGHLRMIRAGIDSLSESTLFGSGIGTQVSDSNWAQVSGNEVITDGLFWSMASEGGFLLAAAYFVMLTLAGLDSCRCWRRPARDYMALGFAIFTACQVCLVIFLNSGLLGKSAAIIYWFTAGLVGAHGRLSVAHYSSVANSPITRRWGSAV